MSELSFVPEVATTREDIFSWDTSRRRIDELGDDEIVPMDKEGLVLVVADDFELDKQFAKDGKEHGWPRVREARAELKPNVCGPGYYCAHCETIYPSRSVRVVDSLDDSRPMLYCPRCGVRLHMEEES